MRIAAISDIHNRHSKLVIEPCDILIVAGDYTGQGTISEVRNFHKWLNKQPARHKLVVQGNHECLSSDTELLTKRGWIHNSDISTNDEILSITQSGNSVWTKIDKYIINTTEEFIAYSNTNVDIMVTPNHRIAHYKIRTNDPDTLNINNISSIVGDIKIPCAAPNLQPDVNISDNFIKLLGWILTDGTMIRTDCYIHQSKPINIASIQEILNGLGYKYSLNFRNRNITEICGKKLKSILPQGVFRIAQSDTNLLRTYILDSKIANKELFNKLSARQLRILLLAIMDGDGSWEKNKTSGALNGIKPFLDWVQELAVQTGIRSNLVEYRPNVFRLNLSFNHSSIEINQFSSKLEKIKKYDTVWCLKVINENFMVRRNGKVYFTGNCGVESNFNLSKLAAQNECPDVLFVEHQLVVIEGLRIFCSAWTPFFHNWAYNAERLLEDACRNQIPFIGDKWKDIPMDIDILVTHGGPHGILDQCYYADGVTPRERVGCHLLLEKLVQIPTLKHHVFGHIHASHGEQEFKGIKFYNVSICGETYCPDYPPTYFEAHPHE